MWELDCEDSWAPKNGCFWTVVLEKTLESPLDCKEIQAVPPKRVQSWVFTGRTGAEAETPILWPSHAKSWLIGKDSDAGKDWGQDEKGTTKDEMAGWHHRLDECDSEWTPGVGDGREAWRAAIHGVTKSWTQLIDWTEDKAERRLAKKDSYFRETGLIQMNRSVCVKVENTSVIFLTGTSLDKI